MSHKHFEELLLAQHVHHRDGQLSFRVSLPLIPDILLLRLIRLQHPLRLNVTSAAIKERVVGIHKQLKSINGNISEYDHDQSCKASDNEERHEKRQVSHLQLDVELVVDVVHFLVDPQNEDQRRHNDANTEGIVNQFVAFLGPVVEGTDEHQNHGHENGDLADPESEHRAEQKFVVSGGDFVVQKEVLLAGIDGFAPDSVDCGHRKLVVVEEEPYADGDEIDEGRKDCAVDGVHDEIEGIESESGGFCQIVAIWDDVNGGTHARNQDEEIDGSEHAIQHEYDGSTLRDILFVAMLPKCSQVFEVDYGVEHAKYAKH
mmetsp:Transcript_29564/g.47018  ORF Transcript_29564/g.47018 Transcript_29564/m.47018 type:complete len:316 (-) Transcript_29564:96-1043(-)